ncbi:MAG: phosphotransferase [Halieaceae bacterium]
MVAALPRIIQLKLEQTLGQWQHWQIPLGERPTVVKLLGDGHSNHSVHVVSGDAGFVVRIDGIIPSQHGLNRQVEWRGLRNAADAGLAPAPRYFNPDLGTLVCDFLPADTPRQQSPRELAALARAIHQLPAVHHRLDLKARVQRYEKQATTCDDPARTALLQWQGKIAELLEALEATRYQPVFCHNDLLSANRLLSGGKLWALDWEYCAMGSHWFELAVISCGEGFSEEHLADLAEAYLSRSPEDQEMKDFAAYRCVYRYLELLWYLTRKVDSEQIDMDEKQAALEYELSALDS